MKDFKARAWDKDRNEYIDFSSLCCPSWSLGEILANYELEQYTGLKDKNGREIYEGDVVRSNNHNPDKYVIEFIEGGFCAMWGDDDYPIDINHFYDSTGCSIEIIGNVHENKELLANG